MRQMRMMVGRGAQYPKEGESWGTRYVLFIYGK